jgi:hypothetical protein
MIQKAVLYQTLAELFAETERTFSVFFIVTATWHLCASITVSRATILKYTVQILVMASVGQSMYFNMVPWEGLEPPRSRTCS